MNSIPTLQNSERQLQRLAAQRQLYSTAKTIFACQLIIGAPVAIVLTFLIMVIPPIKSYVALWGIFITLCDIVWLTPWQKRLRSNAAKIQELFDCDVLNLPWNEFKAGKRPDPELVKEQDEKYKSWSSTMPTLTDWYSKDVGYLPLHIARLVCQRSNCWWDATQRRRYATFVIISVVVIFSTMLFLAMGTGFTIEDFVLMVAAPLSPALLMGYRQYNEQMDAAMRIDKLKEHIESLWQDALSDKSEEEVTARSRAFQDEIFENRTKSPLVFDALFKRLRNDYEFRMNHGVSELIYEAKRRLGLVRLQPNTGEETKTMNDLENYKAILDQYFGSGSAKFNTASGVSNNIIGALNRPNYVSFRSVFLKRCERLAALYPASDTNRKPLLDRLNEMASTGKWDGVYAEMVALDFLNADQNWLSPLISLSKTVPAVETLAGSLAGKNTNFDGYYNEFDICFDVKVLGDKSGSILDGIISEVTGKLGITRLVVMPEYPLDCSFEQFQNNRNELRDELERSIKIVDKTSYVKSAVITDLIYKIKWDAGVLSTVSTYDPFQHAANHHTLLFKHAKKFSKTKPSLIVFVHFPWFSERVVNSFFSRDVFYRSFSRRFFCQYAKDTRPANVISSSFQGKETISQVTEKLSGVLFLEDTSITSRNADDLNVNGFAYFNPNASKKVSWDFKRYLSNLDIAIDDLEYDNY